MLQNECDRGYEIQILLGTELPGRPPARRAAGSAVDPEPTSRAPLEPGEELEPGAWVGDYLVGSLLAVGQTSAVYAGLDPRRGRPVAIKVLRREVADSAVTSGRLLSEACGSDRIEHPALVEIFAVGELADGRPYFVMELLEGGATLADWMHAAAPLACSSAFSALVQISEALAALQNAGFAHRAVSPESIFLRQERSGEVHARLLDATIARALQPRGCRPVFFTDGGLRVASPRYLAPEQLQGQACDGAADVYALGLVLYEIFTGRWPWEVRSDLEQIQAHLGVAPRRDATLYLRSPLLGDLVMDCLDKDRRRRPLVEEIRAELLQARRSWPAHVAPSLPAQPEAARITVTPAEGRLAPSPPGYARYWFALAGAAFGGGIAAMMSALGR